MEYCEMRERGNTRVELQKESDSGIRVCSIEDCPYGNGIKLGLSLNYSNVCQTNGMVEKRGLIPPIQEKSRIETTAQQSQP